MNIQTDRMIICFLYLATCLGCVAPPHILKRDVDKGASDVSFASKGFQFRPTELTQGDAPLEVGSLGHQEIDIVVLCLVGPLESRRVRLVFGHFAPEASTFQAAINMGGPMHTAEAIRRLHDLAKDWRQPFGVLFTVHDKPWRVAATQEPVIINQIGDIVASLRSKGLLAREIQPNSNFTWQGYFLLH